MFRRAITTTALACLIACSQKANLTSDNQSQSVPVTPPSISFVANPENIAQGGSTTLTWNITNATSAAIDNGIGNIGLPGGSITVTPSQTTTYTLAAQGAGGSASASVTVNIGQVPVINSFTVNNQPVAQINWGQSATLNWDISYADSVTITPTVAGVSPTKGSFQVDPLSSTTYTLIASAPAGTVSAQVTLNVVVPSPTPMATPPGSPDTPTTFRADVSYGTTGQLFVTWDIMKGATYYNLLRSTDAVKWNPVSLCSGPGIKYDQSSNSLICRDGGLMSGVQYFYEVQACNTSGCSLFTPAVLNIPVTSNCTNGPNGQIPDLSGLKGPRSMGFVTNVVDPLVTFDPNDSEFASYPTAGVTRRNILVVEMPGSGGQCGAGGTFSDTAKNLGYEYICVNYPNVAEQDQICNGNPDCYGYVSQAKLDATGFCSVPGDSVHCGKDPTTKQPFVNSNPHDGVSSRIVTLLQYLVNNGYNKNGTDWSIYLNGNAPNWSKLFVGGFSQGGVMGAYAAYNYPVAGVHMRSSPPVATRIGGKGQYIPATWLTQMKNKSNLRNFYGLVSANDAHYPEGTYYNVWQALGFTAVNSDAEQKLSSFNGINCNTGAISHNFSTSFIQSPAGGHPDPLAPWNEDVYKFILNRP